MLGPERYHVVSNLHKTIDSELKNEVDYHQYTELADDCNFQVY